MPERRVEAADRTEWSDRERDVRSEDRGVLRVQLALLVAQVERRQRGRVGAGDPGGGGAPPARRDRPADRAGPLVGLGPAPAERLPPAWIDDGVVVHVRDR